jgi:hypothetical protein
MKRILAFVLAAAFICVPAIASAADQPTTISTSAAAGTCIVLDPYPGGTIYSITNSGALMAGTITFYDDTTCTAGDEKVNGASLGALQVISWPFPGLMLKFGLSYKISQTLASNITVVYR